MHMFIIIFAITFAVVTTIRLLWDIANRLREIVDELRKINKTGIKVKER